MNTYHLDGKTYHKSGHRPNECDLAVTDKGAIVRVCSCWMRKYTVRFWREETKSWGGACQFNGRLTRLSDLPLPEPKPKPVVEPWRGPDAEIQRIAKGNGVSYDEAMKIRGECAACEEPCNAKGNTEAARKD